MTKIEIPRLPLARERGGKDDLFTEAAINKAVEVSANNLEMLEYLSQNVDVVLKKAGKINQFSPLRNEIQTLVDNAKFQEEEKEKRNPWRLPDAYLEQPPTTDFGSFHQFLASKFARELTEQTIYLDCALSDSAEFIRGYSNVDGKMLENEELETMDTLFNAWLADNEMISQGGVIYAGTAQGGIQQDKKGNPIIVPADKLRTMLEKTDAFSQFVQKHNPSAEVKVRMHEYAAPKAGPEAG